MFVSEPFTGEKSARDHYRRVREDVVSAYAAKHGAGRRVRIASDAIVLQSDITGQWVNHCRGLSEGADSVRQYERSGAGTVFRWILRVDV